MIPSSPHESRPPSAPTAAVEVAPDVEALKVRLIQFEQECQNGGYEARKPLAEEFLASAKQLKTVLPELAIEVVMTLVALAQEAEDFAAAERYSYEAINLIKGASHLSSSGQRHAVALCNLGRILYQIGSNDENATHDAALAILAGAEEQFKRGAARDPTLRSVVHLNQGEIFFSLGRYSEAADAANRALEFYPGDNVGLHSSIVAMRADALFKANRYGELPPLWREQHPACSPWSGVEHLFFATYVTIGSLLVPQQVALAEEAADRGLKIADESPKGVYCGALLRLGKGAVWASRSEMGRATSELEVFSEGVAVHEPDTASGMRSLAKLVVGTLLSAPARARDREKLLEMLDGPEYGTGDEWKGS